MSDEEQFQRTNASGEQAEAPARAPKRPNAPAPAALPWSRTGRAILLLGGLVAGGLAGAAATLTSIEQRAEIEQIAVADLDAAALSFPRSELGSHVEDAKACRVPLTFVTLVPRDGSNGHLRIRSGDYWTPVIHLGTTPLRVALPYPSPYPTGLGEFQVEGDNAAFDMYLRPGWVGGAVQGAATVHVWWRVKAPC